MKHNIVNIMKWKSIPVMMHFFLQQPILYSTYTTALSLVRNPRTGRKIKVYGDTFNKIIASGGYGFFHGEFMPLKFDPSNNYLLNPLDFRKIAIDNWYEVRTEGSALFVNKPSGILSVPGIGPDKADSLVTRVIASYPTAKICHRLDFDTSGIMIFALDAKTHRDLSKQFEKKSVKKTYVALVDGHLQKDSGRVDLAIGKELTQEGYNRWVIGGTKQRNAVTDYEVLDRFESTDGHKYSRVLIKPLTGRGHQIRLHMTAIGHPLLGDTLHAPKTIAYAAPRLCLHAQSLSCHVADKKYHVEISSVF